MRAVEWDGPSYDLNSGFQLREGRKFVEAIELRGDEIAIDAGCGPGRVTRLLAERLPGGRVTGVDASEAMIETARANLADLHPRVELVVSDLLRFEPAEPLDLVFSTHALHWIGDHDLLFARIYDWLLPGGRLAAVLGGGDNLREVLPAIVATARREPYASHFGGFEHPWKYPALDDAVDRLQRIGFTDVRCETNEVEFAFEDPREFHRTTYLVVHLEMLPPELRDGFIDEVMEGQDDPTTGRFVHLELTASRPVR